MNESPPASTPRLVTFDLDELYRRRAETAERVARETRALTGIEGTIQLVEEALGLSPPRDFPEGRVITKARSKRPTHRAMLLTVLTEADQPLGVREMIDAVKGRFDEAIPRTSVSPLLRKLAARNEVEHDPERSRWKLGVVDRAAVEGEVVKFRGPKNAKRDAA